MGINCKFTWDFILKKWYAIFDCIKYDIQIYNNTIYLWPRNKMDYVFIRGGIDEKTQILLREGEDAILGVIIILEEES